VSLRPGRRLRSLLANASLRVRIMVAAAVLVLVTSAVMGALGTAMLRSYLYGRVDAQLAGFAAGTPRGRPARIPPRGTPQLPSPFLIEEVSAGGKVKLASGSVHGAGPPVIPAARLRNPGVPFTAAAAGAPGHSWRVLVRAVGGGRHVVIAYSLDAVNSTVSRLEFADAAAGVVAIVILAGIGLPLIRVSLSPLARIEDAAEAIAAGDLSRRIDRPAPRTEVGRLAAALNVMLGRIEAAYRAREEGEARARDSEDRMRRFVGDASHELRTPLASIRGLAEFCLQQGAAASRADMTRLVTLILGEATRMGLLVDDLLLLAQVDEGRPLDRQPVDLSSAAAEAVLAARAVPRGHSLSLVASDEPVVVSADSARLRQVIDNLVGNALQHTPAGTAVTVEVDSVPGYGELTVADDGPGLTAEQACRVFERFYRTDGARSRASGGTGLGLSIAAALVGAHQGTITVDSRPGGGGATFRVRLPLAERRDGLTPSSAKRQPAATGSQGLPDELHRGAAWRG
jgi:two-component system, OmpR family, sensor kinase